MERVTNFLPFNKKRRKEDALIPRINPLLFSSLFDTLIQTSDSEILINGLSNYRPMTPRNEKERQMLADSVFKIREFIYKTEDRKLERELKKVEEYAGVDDMEKMERDARLYSLILNSSNEKMLAMHQERVNELYRSTLTVMAKLGCRELLLTHVLGHTLWRDLYEISLDNGHHELAKNIYCLL